jgi:hypothetical protein
MGPQTQAPGNSICNVQRAVGLSGGTIEVVFNGYAANSGPGIHCVGGYGSFTPQPGPSAGGAQVTMTGYGFSNVTQVTFQGAVAAIVSQTDNQLVVTTPPFHYCGSSTVPVNAGVQFTLSDQTTAQPADGYANYAYNCP